jgi:hypothetical protein
MGQTASTIVRKLQDLERNQNFGGSIAILDAHPSIIYHSKPKMARTKAPSAAVQASKGSKITFGDDSENDEQETSFEAGPSRRQGRQEPESDEEEEEESDDDDAPEAVGVSKSDAGVDDVASAAEMLAQ